MLDDIDYSDLSSSTKPAEAKPAKKSTIADRKISAKSDKPTPKPVDVQALAERANELQADLGAPEISDPLAQYGLQGLGALGGLAALYGLYQASKSKPITGPVIQGPTSPAPVAGTPPPVNYDVPAYMRNPAAAPVVTEPVAPAQPDRLQRAAEMIEANRQAGIGQPATPVVEAPIATPLSEAPVDAPAPKPTAGPNSPVTDVVTDEIKSLMNEPVAPPGELRTGTGKPALAGEGPAPKISKRTGQPQFKSEYPSMQAVPAGYAVVPNAQYIDALRQDLGQAEFTKAFTGRDFPTDYEQAVATGKDINRSLGRATREQAKAAGLPYGEITPGIAQRTTSGKKMVNVGGKAGITGALIALSDLAKAETAGQRGLAGANVLEAVLPPTMMIGGAGEGSSTVPSQDPALLLGSPYAFSEAGKKFRQDQAYTRKVGAGRGIAPPSAYRR